MRDPGRVQSPSRWVVIQHVTRILFRRAFTRRRVIAPRLRGNTPIGNDERHGVQRHHELEFRYGGVPVWPDGIVQQPQGQTAQQRGAQLCKALGPRVGDAVPFQVELQGPRHPPVCPSKVREARRSVVADGIERQIDTQPPERWGVVELGQRLCPRHVNSSVAEAQRQRFQGGRLRKAGERNDTGAPDGVV